MHVPVIDVAERVTGALSGHRDIAQVRLTGSRAHGEPTPFSDWDFEIETRRFPPVAEALPALVHSLRPITQQWDRLSEHQTYMLILEGPAKVDLIFDEPHELEPPWTVTAATLPAIDDHFWDWMLWLLSKEAACRFELIAAELQKMFVHLLAPMGVDGSPSDLDQAITSYRDARATQERIHVVRVPRTLEDEAGKALALRAGT